MPHGVSAHEASHDKAHHAHALARGAPALRDASLPRPLEGSLLIVSVLLGPSMAAVHPAPAVGTSVFFSDNAALAPVVAAQGWRRFLLLSHLKPEGDPSLQSKYVKFLAFLRDYPELAAFRSVLYVDHKQRIEASHVRAMLAFGSSGGAGAAAARSATPRRPAPPCDVVIRRTERAKPTIWDEMADALQQPRYKAPMRATVLWLADRLREPGYSDAAAVAHTGLILYANASRALPLASAVHEASLALRQPECQLLWAVLAQGYGGVCQLDYAALGTPPRMTPGRGAHIPGLRKFNPFG